ncbi:hypothetical protein ACVIGB_000661 [Bradyrhizobium sp. USDA 4341]
MKYANTKQVLRSALAIAMCTVLSSPSFAIMACGNSWTPTPPGYSGGWGLTTFDPTVGTAYVPLGDWNWPTYGNSTALFASFLGSGPSFSAADYSLDCSIVLVPPTTKQTWTTAGGWITTPVAGEYACRINKAPTVDMTFVNNLRSQGYTVSVSYPSVDNGSGVGIVTWAKLSNDFNVLCPFGKNGYTSDTNGYSLGPYACAVNNIGMAYVTGAGYQNQFAGAFGVDILNKEAAAGWSATDRANSAVVGLWGPHSSVAGDSCPLQFSGAYPAVMIGTFVAPAPPAPPPPPPPISATPAISNRSASPINVGQAGAIGSAGRGNTVDAGAQGDTAFDVMAFCSAPSARDGKPRSAAWIRACLTSGQ